MATRNTHDTTDAEGGESAFEPNPLISVADLPEWCFPTRRIPQNERMALELSGIERAKNSPGGDTARNDVRGIMGEYVVANLFGADVDTEIYHGGDGGFDFCVDGKLIDVKTRNPRCNNPDLLVDANKKIRADYYVLAQEVSPCEYRVFGYASAQRVRDARVMTISPNSPASNCVAGTELRVVGQEKICPLTDRMF